MRTAHELELLCLKATPTHCIVVEPWACEDRGLVARLATLESLGAATSSFDGGEQGFCAWLPVATARLLVPASR